MIQQRGLRRCGLRLQGPSVEDIARLPSTLAFASNDWVLAPLAVTRTLTGLISVPQGTEVASDCPCPDARFIELHICFGWLVRWIVMSVVAWRARA